MTTEAIRRQGSESYTAGAITAYQDDADPSRLPDNPLARRRGMLTAAVASAAMILGGCAETEGAPSGDREPATQSSTSSSGEPGETEAGTKSSEAAPAATSTIDDEQPTEPEVDPLTISAGEIGSYPAGVIQERFGGLDMKELARMEGGDRARWAYARDFAIQRGVYSPVVPMDHYGNTVSVDGTEYLSTYVEMPSEEGSVIDAEIFQEFGYTRFTEGLEDALLGFGNIYHDIKDKIPNNDQALRRDFINGASSTFVRGGEGYIDGTIQCLDTNTCYEAEEASPLLGEYIKILDELEDDVAISDVQILYINQTANFGAANLTVLIDTKGGVVDDYLDELGQDRYSPLQTRVERGDINTYSFEVSGNNAQPYYIDGAAVPQPFSHNHHDRASYLLRNDNL